LGENKRLQISIPANLMKEVQGHLGSSEVSNNSEFFKEAVRLYLAHLKKDQIKKQLKNGYREMSDLNRDLADEGLLNNHRAISFYEDNLADCD